MFKSQAQRRYMYAKHPDIAKEFEAKTPKGKKLPEHHNVAMNILNRRSKGGY